MSTLTNNKFHVQELETREAITFQPRGRAIFLAKFLAE